MRRKGNTMRQHPVRIGGASGFWGDSAIGAPQLVEKGEIDYLVFDYLAELTMSILAAARLKNPEMGYATDFVTVAMKSVLPALVAKKIRVVSNAGGMNPLACAKALNELAASLGLSLKVVVVQGDDLMPRAAELAAMNLKELQSGAPLPPQLVSANAYLGAEPIAAALALGADVVITGRCVDSAVTLGILMHEFGWKAMHTEDLDKLAQGSLAGHLIECGAQATGGLFTDWQTVPDWANIGYPIVECRADGSFDLTKSPGTGGLATVATVAEQLVYEIGDPAHYVLPDVVCDFTQVTLKQTGPERVEVLGARGLSPTATYKVCATYMQGYRCSGQLTIVGFDAAAKARRTGEAILERTRTLLAQLGLGDYTRTHIEILGAESAYGPHAASGARVTREAVLRLTVSHPAKAALELFAREIAPSGTSFSPGTTGASGRPSVSPSIRQYAFLLHKDNVPVTIVVLEGKSQQTLEFTMPKVPAETAVASAAVGASDQFARQTAAAGEVGEHVKPNDSPDTAWTTVPLVQLAYGRSGDKGDVSNIGIIARKPVLLPYLRAALTEEAVAVWLGHAVKGRVTRYELPGIGAMNFVCEQALDGGGMASMRNDALGKGMGQILLSMPIKIPKALVF
jgi:Acyclic terpene utilisation family protein AtuA